MLATQRDALDARLELIETKFRQFTAVQVYRALGGLEPIHRIAAFYQGHRSIKFSGTRIGSRIAGFAYFGYACRLPRVAAVQLKTGLPTFFIFLLLFPQPAITGGKPKKIGLPTEYLFRNRRPEIRPGCCGWMGFQASGRAKHRALEAGGFSRNHV